MPTTLVFETGPVQFALRQCGGVEDSPAITLQLHATGDAQIYGADGRPLAEARWIMTVHCAAEPATHSLSYATPGERALCSLRVCQSPQRFGLLLDMFKGGNTSEITVDVEGLVTLSDYSRKWDTLGTPTLVVSGVCFDFVLPHSE